MAGTFYNLEEVAEKLSKTEEEIRSLIKDGKLHEFRDGAKQLFRAEEVESLVAELAESEVDLVLDETGEISLEPGSPNEAPSEGGFNLSHVGGESVTTSSDFFCIWHSR